MYNSIAATVIPRSKMHKKDQHLDDSSSTPEPVDISSTNEYDRPMRQVSEGEHIYVYAFCITFRNNARFSAFVHFLSRSFIELNVRHTPLATKGALVAVEFRAQGKEPQLRSLHEELIRSHGSE